MRIVDYFGWRSVVVFDFVWIVEFVWRLLRVGFGGCLVWFGLGLTGFVIVIFTDCGMG